MRTDILERKDEILQWIDEELSLTEMKTRLCCKHHTLKSYLVKMGIDYAGQKSRKGQQKGPNKYKDSSYYTYKGAQAIPSTKLREKLLRDGLKTSACELCGVTEWLGKAIPLELHHKDGDHFNNELSNLQILCPNCHAVATLPIAETRALYKIRVKQTREAEELIAAERSRQLRHSEEIAAKIAAGKQMDASGRYTNQKFSEAIWEDRKSKILDSGVDLTKFGWKTELQQVTGLTRRQVDLTISHFWEDFCDKIYIRN